jgi:hypothetical protein
MLPPIGSSGFSSDRAGIDPKAGVSDVCLQVDGSLDMGMPSSKFLSDDMSVAPRLSVADFVGGPKVLEWAIALRDGKRVSIPSLNHGVLLPSLRKSKGEGSSTRQEQETVQTSLSTGSEA